MATWKKVLTNTPASDDIASTDHADGKVLEAEGAGNAAKWVHKQIKVQTSEPTQITDFTDTDSNTIMDSSSGYLYQLKSDNSGIYKIKYDTMRSLSWGISSLRMEETGQSTNLLNTDYELGAETDVFKSAVEFGATYSNMSGTLAAGGASNNYLDAVGEASGDSNHFGDGNFNIGDGDLSGSFPTHTLANFDDSQTIDLNYPATGVTFEGDNGKYITFTLNANDGTSGKTTEGELRFYNNAYICAYNNTSPSSANLMANIKHKKKCKSTLLSALNAWGSAGTGTFVSVTCSNQYVFVLVPDRISGSDALTFKINGTDVTFVKYDGGAAPEPTVSITNDVGTTGFTETFDVYRSPSSYNETFNLQVIT